MSSTSGGPGSGVAMVSTSWLCPVRPVRRHSACRNAGDSGPDRSPGGSCEATQSGSASMKMIACAVKPMTPASRAEGCGRIVTRPSAGGNLPAATSSRMSVSD